MVKPLRSSLTSTRSVVPAAHAINQHLVRSGARRPRWSEPVRAKYVHPREHATRLALVDRDISRALPLAASPRLGIPHRARNDRKLPPADLSRDSHRYALNNEVHRRVVQRLRQRLAGLYLEAGTAQSLPQRGSEMGIGALAVVDDDARERQRSKSSGEWIDRRSASWVRLDRALAP